MYYQLRLFNSLPGEVQAETAGLISAYTKGELGEKPQMLPVEPIDIYQKHLGVVALRDDVFSGYVGATNPIRHNELKMLEVGSLWVPEQHRGKGVAHSLVSFITKSLLQLGETPYAFCNPLSKPIFIELGYVEGMPELIPPAAYSECERCPLKPANSHCCDDALIYGSTV